jgi:UDP-glucose 4-epimerase
VNVFGTLNILEACRGAGADRFVFASSNAPLGWQPPPATEDKAPLPISPYGASKLAGEGYCLAYHGSWGLGTVALRFGNVYGPYSAHKNSVVARFCKGILATGQITIDGDGEQTRDFIYVDDLCRAIALALESTVGGEVFQIATGVETSVLELARRVREVAGSAVNVHHAPERQGDIRKNYSAVSKVREWLGWESQVKLHQGLRLTWEWFYALGAVWP